METSRCLVEVFKFMWPYDVLKALSVVSRQWNKVSTWTELWDHFCEQYDEDDYDQETSQSFLQRYRTLSTESARFLVSFRDSRLLLFDCLLKKTLASMEVVIKQTGTAVMLSKTSVFVCGGKVNSKGTILVTFKNSAIKELNDLLYRHEFSGSAKVGNVVYVFGNDGNEEDVAEKFLLSGKTWKALQPMPVGRSAFTPCVHRKTIFICGGNVPESHTFDTTTEQYSLLPFTLPYAGWCIASYYQGTLYLEIAQNRFTWRPDKGTSIKKINRGITP